MFGQVLDKLDAYFGRTYLLSRFAPWLMCVAANAVIASFEYPAVRQTLLAAVTDFTAAHGIALLLVMVGVWVVSYGTSPAVQFVISFLEGTHMPSWLQRLLVLSHAWRRDMLDHAGAKHFQHLADSISYDEFLQQLIEARRSGSSKRKIGDREAIERAAGVIERIEQSRQLLDPIQRSELEDAARALSDALRLNCADASVLLEKEDVVLANRLDKLHRIMWSKLVPYAKAQAEELDQLAAVERHRRFATEVLAPTGLGNEAAALRSYCATRYGIDFDFFWPRFLLIARKDPKLSDALATAKIQVDFSIVSLSLSTVSIVVWSAVLVASWEHSSPLTAALVVGLGPLAVYSWLGIVQAAYAEFADVVRSAIDLHRFDVLAALHQALPVSSSDETRCWEAVQRLALFDEHRTNVAFRHATS